MNRPLLRQQIVIRIQHIVDNRCIQHIVDCTVLASVQEVSYGADLTIRASASMAASNGGAYVPQWNARQSDCRQTPTKSELGVQMDHVSNTTSVDSVSIRVACTSPSPQPDAAGGRAARPTLATAVGSAHCSGPTFRGRGCVHDPHEYRKHYGDSPSLSTLQRILIRRHCIHQKHPRKKYRPHPTADYPHAVHAADIIPRRITGGIVVQTFNTVDLHSNEVASTTRAN